MDKNQLPTISFLANWRYNLLSWNINDKIWGLKLQFWDEFYPKFPIFLALKYRYFLNFNTGIRYWTQYRFSVFGIGIANPIYDKRRRSIYGKLEQAAHPTLQLTKYHKIGWNWWKHCHPKRHSGGSQNTRNVSSYFCMGAIRRFQNADTKQIQAIHCT